MDSARILIVEDEGIVAMDLESRLSVMGHVVVGRVASGEDAVREAGSLRPDVALMDIRLRGSLSGIEAARTIWSRFRIPVVYLTAIRDPRTLEHAMDVTRSFGYAAKPFDDAQLEAAVEGTLRRHRALSSKTRAAARTTEK